MPNRKRLKQLHTQAAAYLSAEQGFKQRDIATVLDVTQSHVSRLLRAAIDEGWLEVRYRFLGFSKLSDERRAYLKRLGEPRGLLAALRDVPAANGVRVRSVRVISSGGEGTTAKAFETRLRRFSGAACRRFVELMSQSDVLAVTWGSTLSHLVAALERTAPAPSARRKILVPVCGEPTEVGSNRETSTQLVRRLHKLYSARQTPASLTGVPALIPRRLPPREAGTIRRFLTDTESYREVFGPPDPLIDRVDTLFTSTGGAERPMGFIHEELLSAGSRPGRKLTEARLGALVAGDVGGVLLPRSGLTAARRDEVRQLNAMWTGVRLEHLERIATDAERTKRPGVVVVSIGKRRAEVIAAAVERGLVNELLIDRELAEELEQLLTTPARTGRPRPRSRRHAPGEQSRRRT